MSKLFNRKVTLAVVVVAIIAIALVFSARKQKAANSQYFMAAVDHGPVRNVVNATGVVQTLVTVQVGSQVSGQVEELYADYNSIVKRGQLLAKLDARNFQAQVENARASVAAAQARVRSAEAELKTQAANLLSSKANLLAARVTRDKMATLFQRASELSKRGVASMNDYDNAKAGADSAVAKYEQAEAAIAQTEAQSSASAAQLEQTKAHLQQAVAEHKRA